MSITEINAINENFPIAGVDQPSQGYRDNFANIKTALTDLDVAVITVIDDISDVDTTTVAPVTSDVLLFDGAKWAPSSFEILNDLTPQLGGPLDTNGFALGDGTNTILGFVEATTPVNWITMSNADTGLAPVISAVGSDVDVGLTLKTKNNGSVIIDSTGTESDLFSNLPLTVRSSETTIIRSGNNSSGNGYGITLRAGDSTGAGGAGGSVFIRPGLGNGAGAHGNVRIRDAENYNVATFTQSTAVGAHDNYIIFYNDISGQSPGLMPFGLTDTNIGLDITPIGTGRVKLSAIAYPNTDGTTSGDVMKTDAAGTLSFAAPTDLGEFTVAGLPDPTLNANAYALATDASGGRTIVRSDGTAWKIVAVEGATVS